MNAPESKRMALVITGDAQAGALCCEVLPHYGLVVEWIRDGSGALSCLQQAEPDLIVLDLQLPGVSGLEVLDFVRQNARLAVVPVFMLTADVICVHLTGVRVAAELLKPVSRADLIDAISPMFPAGESPLP